MKALSIKQPWAWAIIHGGKPIENRTWKTNFRGIFAVHASKTFDMEGYEWISENENRLGLILPQPSYFEKGGIIGTVELIDCVHYHGSRWFFGPFGFVLRNPEPCKFEPSRGALGFFDI